MSGAADVTLGVRSKGPKKRRLRRKGKAKVTARVTFVPGAQAASPQSASQKIKLVRK